MSFRQALERIKTHWNPRPISQPLVDPFIQEMSGIERTAEAIRYSVLSIEFWVSPNGKVREWLRNNTHLAAWLAVPAFLIVPIITFVLIQVGSWLAVLVGILGDLIVIPVLTFIAWLVIQIVKALFQSK